MFKHLCLTDRSGACQSGYRLFHRPRTKKPGTMAGLFVVAGLGLTQVLLIRDDRVVQGVQQRLAYFQLGVL